MIDKNMLQYSNDSLSPLYFMLVDGKTLDALGTSHYFNITGQPQTTTKSTTSTSPKPSKSSTATSTVAASSTGAVMNGTPRHSTTPATATASSTAPPQSSQKLPKKAIAGISVGATIGGILILVVLGFLAHKYRIWSHGIFHNIFTRGQRSTAQHNIAELPGNHPAELPVDNPTELPTNQETKGSRAWIHPRGSGGLYEVS